MRQAMENMIAGWPEEKQETFWRITEELKELERNPEKYMPGISGHPTYHGPDEYDEYYDK